MLAHAQAKFDNAAKLSFKCLLEGVCCSCPRAVLLYATDKLFSLLRCGVLGCLGQGEGNAFRLTRFEHDTADGGIANYLLKAAYLRHDGWHAPGATLEKGGAEAL